MSGLIVGTGFPFLGPAVAAWIILIVGVMAFYFRTMFRQNRSTGAPVTPEWRRPIATESRIRSEPLVTSMDRAAPATDLPAYDMENFPHEQWDTAAGPAHGMAQPY